MLILVKSISLNAIKQAFKNASNPIQLKISDKTHKVGAFASKYNVKQNGKLSFQLKMFNGFSLKETNMAKAHKTIT